MKTNNSKPFLVHDINTFITHSAITDSLHF